MSELPVISVSELVHAFKEVVETALPPCCVEGEISNCRKSPAGHWYLTLKDDQSEIGAVIWKSAALRMRFEPKDGMKCLATGSLQVYVARGTCQFVIARLLPQGIGELEMAFRQLRDKLSAEGLFDDSRKRRLPKIPRRIALVTSPSSAAVRDMIQVITRRWPPVQIVVVPVRVQGDGAAEEIARALRQVHRIPGVDIVITGRGGGSLEDLWCFNTEIVARAIAACKVPVIAAVGHEIDVSIADLVADCRALTPSEAGELVVPSVRDIRDALQSAENSLRKSLRARLEQLRMRLSVIEARSLVQRPMSLVDQKRMDCDILADRAVNAMRRITERRAGELQAVAASLQALSPLQVLSRGYSLTLKNDGTILRTGSSLEVGDVLQTRLLASTVTSTVTGIAEL